MTTEYSPAWPDERAEPLWQDRLGSETFILLDDARPGGAKARLYRKPRDIIETRDPHEVRACLERIRGSRLHAAGFLTYEAGHALEPKLAPLCRRPEEGEPPLLWFALFDGFDLIDPLSLLPGAYSGWAGRPRPRIDRATYEAAVAIAKGHIESGDIYQANLTFPADVETAGEPMAVYATLRARAQGGHGGLLFTGEHWLLSFSPELFFTLVHGRLTARPMKGTALRGASEAEDRVAMTALRNDEKQRAENLMIVDLLRNDLSRVSQPGTVKVPELFAVETYPTVHQMTSTVVAELEEGLGPIDVVESIFPCGSITGAPKIRAMEIIDGLEQWPRRVYTGAIGRVAPDGEAEFNVAIRTLTMKAGESRASMGLGSGIVADSVPADEWRECLAKGAFVETGRSFDLIETMRFDPQDGIADLDRHLARLKSSAATLGFAFDRHDARNELQAATFRLRGPRKLRLLLSRTGAIAIEARPLPKDLPDPVEAMLMPLPVSRDDFRLRHKTSDRSFYEDARAASGAFEAVFVDTDGFLTEGSFTNLFVKRHGRLLTPPLSRGLLPGILRARLIEEGKAAEANLRPADLAGGFFVGNAVRGLLRAVLRPTKTVADPVSSDQSTDI
ncbi:aminodeoxychorismate synthase component I [Sphingosinicella rhizophila]|uniref:Probable branched-chain-amino-acid aminotransferase n=1 Tax=Sphingosinicella rhizophila TaxID=3050082 RepID=A0ABU3Q7P6_9SPHN|nr:aminodeoxychorismate synthase component I [Sphingosinicella sp. GR2756]MDT9599429.1 aminodeoxychorismate synthase component I [Sphingosinicella sp. GR2756]